MNVTTVTNTILRFTFDTSPTPYATLSCYMIHKNNNGILIDTGFYPQTKEIISYCETHNITITAVIISHFHWDHIAGLSLFTDIPIYGRANALDSQQKLPESKRFEPTIKIDSSMIIEFESIQIELIANPGHSVSTLLIVIEESILMVADDILYSKDNKAILPFLADMKLDDEINALQTIAKYTVDLMLLSHGPVLKDRTFIQRDIKNRLKYLTLLQGDPTMTYTAIKEKYYLDFEAPEWHLYNQKAAKESK